MDIQDEKLIFQPFTIDGNIVNAHDIISKLKFISKIEVGEKISSGKSVSSPTIISDTRWYNFLRTFGYNGGSKKDTLQFIKNTTDSALEIAKKCFASHDPFHNRIAHLIIESLKEADVGIQNIINTYSDQRWFVSEVETFRQILEAKINAIVLSFTENI